MRAPNQDHIFGARVLVNPSLDDVPRMQLLPETREVVTPEFAARMNQWMLEFFGTRNHAVRLEDGSIVVGPKTLAALRLRNSAVWGSNA